MNDTELADAIEAECYNLKALEAELYNLKGLEREAYAPGSRYWINKRRYMGIYPLKSVAKCYVQMVYHMTNGNARETAMLLGVDRRTIKRYLLG